MHVCRLSKYWKSISYMYDFKKKKNLVGRRTRGHIWCTISPSPAKLHKTLQQMENTNKLKQQQMKKITILLIG